MWAKVSRLVPSRPLLRRMAHARPQKIRGPVTLPKFATVSNLSNILKVRFVDLQLRMQDLGYVDTEPDHIVDDENAQLIADELGIEALIAKDHGADIYSQAPPADLANCPSRPPVIALMGHVDHGKTTLLDHFRSSSIVAAEKGGITQHIGAFMTKLRQTKRDVCFLDTPGHEAFLKLRQRGAHLTDIVLLVVAADDSVMPQTKEAIKHAKSAGVPMLVAITKTDRPDSQPAKVIADLAANGVDVEDFGGDTQCIPVSVPRKSGLDDLESALIALIEVLDVRAPTAGNAEGVIVESHKINGLGSVATMIVRRGTLQPRATIVAGTAYCTVRQMYNEANKTLKLAPPGTPVRVTGWQDLPEPGDTVLQASTEDLAKTVVANRLRLRQDALEAKQVEIMNENRRIEQEQVQRTKEREERLGLGLQVAEEAVPKNERQILNYIIKADVRGSAEAVADSIKNLQNEKVAAMVLFSGLGTVTENDLFRAQTADATILAFATQIPKPMQRLADKLKVKVARYDVIYKLLEDIAGKLAELLPPVITRKITGVAELRQVFKITVKKSFIHVAGIKVIRGSYNLQTRVQVLRGTQVVYDGKLSSIRHGKEQVEEAHKGSEYGMSFDKWHDFKEGDIIEAYEEHRAKQYL